jgi:adhesin transport system outer membrane protein
MRYGNQKWTVAMALAAIPAVVAATVPGGAPRRTDSTSMTSDDALPTVRHISPRMAAIATASAAQTPSIGTGNAKPAQPPVPSAPPPPPPSAAPEAPATVRRATASGNARAAGNAYAWAPLGHSNGPGTQRQSNDAITLSPFELSNEAAAAGMRSMLDSSRRKTLSENLEREGLRTPDAPVPAGPSYDLQQVVAMAIANYPSIRTAMASVGQQQAGVDVARAGYYPSVQVGVNTGHQGVYGSGQAASASVSQMLYDFGKVKNAVTSAESSVRTSELQVRAEIDRVAMQAALAAVDLERYTSLEASARAQLDAVMKLLELAKKRAQLGASNQADPTQAMARVSAAEATLQQIRNMVSQQRTQLATLIGRDVPAGGVVVSEDVLKQAVSSIHPDVENAVAVQIAKSQKDTAAADLAEAKSNTKPTLSLQAGVTQYFGSASNYMQNGRDYTLTFGVTHNIFQGGALTARVRGASEALRGADERIQTAQLQAENDRRIYEEQMTSLASRMATLKARRASIVATQKLYKEQYLSLGTRSLLDLLNSEAEIYQAESDEINARHDLWGAEISYINTTGYMRDVFQLGNGS